MKNTTEHIVRHSNHRHSRLFQQLIIEDKLKSESPPNASTAQASYISVNNFTQSLENAANNCFTTNQVLFIIAITCFLNFAFIVLIMMCVQILGSTTNEREMSDENAMLSEDREELFGEDGLNGWESSRLRIASLPDNLFSKNISERLLRSKTRKQENERCEEHSYPTSRTYHFHPSNSFTNDDTDSDDTDSGKYNHRGFHYPLGIRGTGYKVLNFDPVKYEKFYAQNNT